MPIKKGEGLAKVDPELLQIGRYNNIIRWSENMRMEVSTLYGLSGSFFVTNVRYAPPLPMESDYVPAYPPHIEGEEAQPAITAALIAKLREGAFEANRKAVDIQRANVALIWPLMWAKMSVASQSKVREDPDFENALLHLDCIRLWNFIRRTHLTHVFGDGDPMAQVNVQDQESRYALLRQGDREYITSFKTRFDHQVMANAGAGVPAVLESKRALDFIMRLDPKRYKGMLSQMRNNALREVPGAYPATLAGAFRIASGWTNEDSVGPQSTGGDHHAAFLADTAFVIQKSTVQKENTKRETGEKTAITRSSSKACYVCGKKGHLAYQCADRKEVISDKVLVTSGEFQEDTEDDQNEWNSAFVTTSERLVLFSRYEILLDNEASLNVFRDPELLSDIGKARRKVIMKGVQSGAQGVEITCEGTFQDCGRVFYSEKASANILSFACQVDSGAEIQYDSDSDRFTMRPHGSCNIYSFQRKNIEGSEGRFYSCDIRTMITQDETALVQTVDEQMRHFTKRDIEGAARARLMKSRMGYPSTVNAIQMVTTGSNFGLSARDFHVADVIWGPDIQSLKGKTKKLASNPADMTVTPLLVQEQQVLSVDVMFVERVPILLGVAHPLDLTMAADLLSVEMNKPSRAAAAVRRGLEQFLGVLSSHNFTVSVIMSDGEGAIGKLAVELNKLGIEVDISGAGGHVSRIERKLQTVKGRIRAHMAGSSIPFTLSLLGIMMLTFFCVSRLNLEVSSTRPYGHSPRQMLTGRPLNAKIDVRCAFGDYVQATVPNTNNSMSTRTDDCIAMLPTGNRTGSVKMLSLGTGKIVTRDQFKILPMPRSAIVRLNQLAALDGRYSNTSGLSTEQTQMEDVAENPSLLLLRPVTTIDYLEPTQSTGTDVMAPDHIAQGHGLADEFENIDHESEEMRLWQPETHPGNSEPEPEALLDTVANGRTDGVIDRPERTYAPDIGENADNRSLLDFFRTGNPRPVGEVSAVLLTTSVRDTLERQLLRTGNFIDKEFAMTISVRAALREHGEEARGVILSELRQMITKRVWRPVKMTGMTRDERRRIIRSSMFIKEKFFSSGAFEKLKARLVAGGDQQDRSLYENLSAPTVSTSSVFAVMAVAASEGRRAMVIDIGGAYLHADMDAGVIVHMRLDNTISALMIEIDPTYSAFLDEKGCIVVQLDKALYGCVESAALWHNNIKKTLTDAGFVQNPHDQCVFNKVSDKGAQCTVAIHVDDLLVTSTDQKALDSLATLLTRRYGEISRADGPSLGYLGMSFDLTVSGEARITMPGFVNRPPQLPE